MLNQLKFVIGMLSNKIYNGNRNDWNLPPPLPKKKKKKQLTWQNARQLSNYKHDVYTIPLVLK